MKRRTWLFTIVATLALVAGGPGFRGQAQGALVYWQNFENGNGVADLGVGDLGITNTAGGSPGNTAFTSTGGVFGGAYDATSNVTANNSVNFNGITSTGAAGGSALSALPNSGTLNQFTISFWVKTQTFSNNSGRAGRLITLGQSGTTDILNANSFGVVQIASNAASGPTKFAPYFGTSDLTAAAGLGANNTLNEWTFVAVSYDGTSSNGDNSLVQQSATGSSINGQFYRGTDTAAVVRTDLPIVTTVGTPSSASLGPLALGVSPILFLANRPALNRSLDGTMDDIRIYDSVLSAAEIDSVRAQGLAGIVPEPSSLFLVSFGLLGLLRLNRKSRQQ
jgi:hypothetical protein